MADKPVKGQEQNAYSADAPPVHEADSYGQIGKVRDAKHPEEKASPDTVAQVQELPDGFHNPIPASSK